MLFWYVNGKYINMFFISISLIDFGVGFVTPLMLLIETACLVTMLRLGFKRRAAWEQTPPLRLRQNFLGYCTALFWFVAVNLTWLNWSAARIFFSSDPFVVSLAFGSLALFLILNSWVAWKSCRMTYELALALCRHQRQYGYATLAGWLSIVPGVNFLIWLILLMRLCSMELPRGFRRWIAIAIALILLTPGLWLLTVPWIWSGCFLAIGVFAAGVLTQGIVYARPDVVAPFPADCRRRFVRWITPAAVLIGMALASWVAFSIYTHWCHIRARLAFAAQGISVADNKAPGGNDAYPVFQELAACWRSEYIFRLDPLKNIQTGLFLLKELPAGVESALTLTLDHHAETIRLLDSILLPEQSLRFNVRHLWKIAPECAILTDLLQLEQLRLLRAMQNGDTEEIRHIWQQMETLHYWLIDNAMIPAKFDYAGKWTWQMAHEPILNRWHFSDEVLQEQLEATMRMEAHWIKQWKHMWAREAVRISSESEDKIQFHVENSYRCPLACRRGAITETFPIKEITRLFQAYQLSLLTELSKLPEQHPEPKQLQLRLENSLFQVCFCVFVHHDWVNNDRIFMGQLAQSRVRYGALGAELYRRKYGQWPEQWSDLVPEFLDAVPLNPYTMTPLTMEHGELACNEYTAQPAKNPDRPTRIPTPQPNLPASAKSDFDADETVEIPPLPIVPEFWFQFTPSSNMRQGFRISCRVEYSDRESKRYYDITFSWYH